MALTKQHEKFAVAGCNCGTLRKATRRISNFYDSQLAPSGLRVSQFPVLMLLNNLGPMSIGAIADRMGLDRTTAGRNLQPLEKANFIRIAPSARDGRQRVAAITAGGHAALKKALPLWQTAQRRFEEWNGPANAAALRGALNALRLAD